MDTLRSFRLVAAIGAAVTALLLCGCGSDSGRAKEKGRSRSVQVRAVESSLNQLNNTLEQLKIEQARQRELIATAESEVESLRNSLKAIRTRASAPKKEPMPPAGEAVERKEPERSAIGQLLLLAFVVFLVVFGTHLYRQRNKSEEDDEAEQPAWEPPSPPKDETPPPAEEEDPPKQTQPPAEESEQDTSSDS